MEVRQHRPKRGVCATRSGLQPQGRVDQGGEAWKDRRKILLAGALQIARIAGVVLQRWEVQTLMGTWVCSAASSPQGRCPAAWSPRRPEKGVCSGTQERGSCGDKGLASGPQLFPSGDLWGQQYDYWSWRRRDPKGHTVQYTQSSRQCCVQAHNRHQVTVQHTWNQHTYCTPATLL